MSYLELVAADPSAVSPSRRLRRRAGAAATLAAGAGAWLALLGALGCAHGGDQSNEPNVRRQGDAGPPARSPRWLEDAGPEPERYLGAPDAGEPFPVADAGPADASVDAGRPDAGPHPGLRVVLQCNPAVMGNETSAALSLSDAFWPGVRFEVPDGSVLEVDEVGLNARSSSAGTLFAAIVALTGPRDRPDTTDLYGADVVRITTLALPGGARSVTATTPVGVSLTGGHYALIFGTGAHGATTPLASVHNNAGGSGCGSNLTPFVFRRSDGAVIEQAATPHMSISGRLR